MAANLYLRPLVRVNVRGSDSGIWLESSVRYALAEARSPRPGGAGVLAKLAEVSGLKRGGESEAQLADAFIAHVRKLNADFGIPTQVEKLKESDIAAITDKALSEAHMFYAVPRYMDVPECQAFIRQMLPLAA